MDAQAEARRMIEQYGDDADIFAAMNADARNWAGRPKDRDYWKAVIEAIDGKSCQL